jgi:hypothetical protein
MRDRLSRSPTDRQSDLPILGLKILLPLLGRADEVMSKSISVVGTNRTTSDVRNSVATGGKPDIAAKVQFGRE